jgi:hypothetical protein
MTAAFLGMSTLVDDATGRNINDLHRFSAECPQTRRDPRFSGSLAANDSLISDLDGIHGIFRCPITTNKLYLNDARLGDVELERNATDPLLAPTAIPVTSGFTIHLCGSS